MDNKNTMDKALYLPEAQVMNLLSQVEDLTDKLNKAKEALKDLSEEWMYSGGCVNAQNYASKALKAIEKEPTK